MIFLCVEAQHRSDQAEYLVKLFYCIISYSNLMKISTGGILDTGKEQINCIAKTGLLACCDCNREVSCSTSSHTFLLLRFHDNQKK